MQIKLEVKIGVGPAFKEIIALGANWVVLDRFVVCAQIVDFFMWILSFWAWALALVQIILGNEAC
jgi:hypothetical protein